MQKYKSILASVLILSLFSQNAFAFLPLGSDNIIIQNIQTSGGSKQGTYNQTLANNSPVNIGGHKLNFINGTGNPIVLKNSTNGMVNVTIGLASSMGVSSLNALTGALTIACVSGNTTCTTSGGNTITVNTAYNIVTTGLSAQTINKALTMNNLILGGQMNINGQTFQSGGHTYSWPSNSGTVCLTNQTGSCGTSSGSSTYDTMANIGTGQGSVYAGNTTKTNFQFKTLKQGANIAITNNTSDLTIAVTGLLSSAITSVNSQTGPAITVNRGTVTNMSSVTNSSNVISYQMKNDIVLTNGSAQTVTKQLTLNTGVLGGNLVTTGFGLSNGGHISTPPATTGTLCQTNQSSVCGAGISAAITSINSDTTAAQKIVRQFGNTTVTNSSGTITIGFGVNPVITGGSAQEITKGLTLDKIIDLNSFIIDNSDNTKKLGFELSGMTTGITTTIRNNATISQGINLPATRQTETFAIRPSLNATTPSDPSGTTSTSGVMTGLLATFTPQVTGRIQLIIEGDIGSSAAADGAKVDARTGTTSQPANGAALTGNVCGKAVQVTAVGVNANREPFTLTCQITGLTIGTKIWVEMGQYAITAGTASVTNISVSIMEI